MGGKIYKTLTLLILITAFAFLSWGCTATNSTLATKKLTAGEKAITQAKEGDASVNAPSELAMAEGKLTQARKAFANKEYEKACALADQASVDAEYAHTKAAAEKNKKVVDEMKKDNDTLRQEIERLSKQ